MSTYVIYNPSSVNNIFSVHILSRTKEAYPVIPGIPLPEDEEIIDLIATNESAIDTWKNIYGDRNIPGLLNMISTPREKMDKKTIQIMMGVFGMVDSNIIGPENSAIFYEMLVAKPDNKILDKMRRIGENIHKYMTHSQVISQYSMMVHKMMELQKEEEVKQKPKIEIVDGPEVKEPGKNEYVTHSVTPEMIIKAKTKNELYELAEQMYIKFENNPKKEELREALLRSFETESDEQE